MGSIRQEPASPVPSLKQVGSMSSNVSQISSVTDMEEAVDENGKSASLSEKRTAATEARIKEENAKPRKQANFKKENFPGETPTATARAKKTVEL